ncbi:hypothetical protein [Actinoplanes couchii]|uniref:Uncharacterized protein n=1 Tax=Actinoplanes couchii TaxID=403638 RepID=A0ABQ3XJV3_9ACTN|nr:hypothetical protein [Actinoplanes couchii]MDR6324273.1 hypothetical protein [Actinoplanes couchii]GID58782.1 hypothetical protein Aco03nite_071860 [Actinoplanes couchii]
MYAWIWRKLPGGLWAKLTCAVVLLTAVGTLLWYVVFPWATPLLPFDDVQVEAGTGQDADTTVPGDDELPYSTTSNQPNPNSSR